MALLCSSAVAFIVMSYFVTIRHVDSEGETMGKSMHILNNECCQETSLQPDALTLTSNQFLSSVQTFHSTWCLKVFFPENLTEV